MARLNLALVICLGVEELYGGCYNECIGKEVFCARRTTGKERSQAGDQVGGYQPLIRTVTQRTHEKYGAEDMIRRVRPYFRYSGLQMHRTSGG